MKPKNIKEAEALVERYETITIEEIPKHFYPHTEPGRSTSDQF